jgi:hypothetical protein
MKRKEFDRRSRSVLLIGLIWGLGCIVLSCVLMYIFNTLLPLIINIFALFAFPLMDMLEPDIMEVEDD